MGSGNHNPSMQSLWMIRLGAALVWAALAASAVYWGLRVGQGAPAMPVTAVPAPTTLPETPVLARVLGGGAAALPKAQAVASSRYALVGVAADTAGRSSVALIAVDGAAARPYRVGTAVDDALVLKAVHARSVQLASALDAPVALTLELPERVSASAPGPVPKPGLVAVNLAVSPGVVPGLSEQAQRTGIARRSGLADPASRTKK